MAIKMKIKNIKSIQYFEFDLPTERGLYAITGENGSGKSTILSCAATSFYNPLMYSYFGAPQVGAKIEFEYEGRIREIKSHQGRWFNAQGNLGIAGFFEGSLIFGNRFKDVDFEKIKTLSKIKKNQLNAASDFVQKHLGSILHDDPSYYKNLYILNSTETERNHLLRQPYFYENNGVLVNQLSMSTGENLLITILHSLKIRLGKTSCQEVPILILLDEIELALHSSALRRLVFFLNELSADNNFMVMFSTHSIELIRSIKPENIYYLQQHLDKSIEVVNPCYPVYATRNLESSNYGHDYIIMVEDDLARIIVEKILYKKRLLSNKRILVIAVGGWTQVLRFAYDTIRSNLTLSTTKIMIILDRDIKNEVPKFLKSEHIGFSIQPNFLPIQSLEKYLLDKLVVNVDHDLFRRLSDYTFQGKSLSNIINAYQSGINNKVYTDVERIKNGKILYELLRHEMRNIRKSEDELLNAVVDYLFEKDNQNLNELSEFLETNLK